VGLGLVDINGLTSYGQSMMRRVVLTVLSVTALLSGLLVGASPATAANVGTVTVSYSSFVYSVTPSSIPGGDGDTFTLANTLTSGNSDPNYYVALQNETGSVSLGGTICSAATDCEILDVFSGTASGVFTVSGAGTLKVLRFYQSGPATQIGTLTISGGGSSATVSDPALVYPTAYINANGGTCTGTLEFTKYNGQNGTITTPTSSTCTRTGYTLRGWARSADARSAEWAPDTTVPIGTDSFTLYAIWAANGVEVTYDANVGLATPCLDAGVDLPAAAERRATSVVTPASSGQAVSVGSDGLVRWTSTAPASPCSPLGYTLAGWSTSPTGVVRAGGQANDIVSSGDGIWRPWWATPGGDRLTLYAVWSAPTYGITMGTASTTLSPGDSVLVTVTATLNGGAAAGVPVALGVPPASALTFAGGSDGVTVTTDSRGLATVTMVAARTGSTSVTAAYGDRTAAVGIEVQDSTASASITITGSRTTVSGKPGFMIDGVTTGLPAGSTVVPYLRFPGETSYTAGSARPVVDANGVFTWSRKTGKKVYVYIDFPDLGVKSNRVIISAN
jgi:uncharacterized repeat protein (TIGR02543 family)